MKVLIVDSFPDNFLAQLDQLPVSYTNRPQADRNEVLSLIPDYDVLIINSKVRVDRELIDLASKLKLILRAGVGMDHFDLAYLAEKGITALNCQGANADAVGEHTLGMLLSLRHNLIKADHEVRNFSWHREANRGHEIKGKTVGIIGYGHTGSAVARRLSGFECRVIAYDKYKEDFGESFVEEVGMEEIFAQSDILSLHIPLDEDTRGLVNTEFLNSFHKPIYFLNLARGPIVELEALTKALDEGKVIAAGLDVLPNEKLSTLSSQERLVYENLFDRKNVILSPHVGGWTFESRENINQRIIQHLEGFGV